MRRAATTPEAHSEVIDWLNEQAHERGIANGFRATVVGEDNEWLHVAVQLGAIRDISKRASLLQELEDSWDEQAPAPHWKLLLIPTYTMTDVVSVADGPRIGEAPIGLADSTQHENGRDNQSS